MKYILESGVLTCELILGPIFGLDPMAGEERYLFHNPEDAESFLRRFSGSGRNMRLLRDLVRWGNVHVIGMDDFEVLRQAALLLWMNRVSIRTIKRKAEPWRDVHSAAKQFESSGSKPFPKPVAEVRTQEKKTVSPEFLAQAAAFKQAAATGALACEP